MNHTIFFDLDRTLLDFTASEKKGLRMVFDHFGIPLTNEIYQRYLVQNQELWSAYESGLIPREIIFATRFADIFAHFGIDADGDAFEEEYRKALAFGSELMENAFDVVETLAKHFPLYVMTNGLISTQEKRMSDSGILPFFQDIFVSERIGLQKPMPEFFEYCFARIPNFKKEGALLIGDSLTSDIQGGNAVDMETCWFNPAAQTNNTPHKPTYEIQNLLELLTLLHI